MSPERLKLLADLATTPRVSICQKQQVTFYDRRDGKLDRYCKKSHIVVREREHSVVTPEVVENTLLRLQTSLRSSLELIESRLKRIDDYFAGVSPGAFAQEVCEYYGSWGIELEEGP